MCQTKKIYKNNMLLSVYILFCLQTLHVYGVTVSTHYLEDALSDVTRNTISIYRIINLSNIDDKDGFRSNSFFTKYNGSYTIELHSKPKPVGISVRNEKLVRTNVKELFNVESIESFQNSSRLSVSFDSTFWTVKKIFPNGDTCDRSLDNQYTTPYYHTSDYTEEPSLDNTDTTNKNCFNTLVFKFFDYIQDYYNYNDYWDSKNLFSLVWTPDKDHTCLSITYMYRLKFVDNNNAHLYMEIVNENDELISNFILKNNLYDENIKVLKFTDIAFMKDQKYVLKFKISRLSFDRYVNYNLNSDQVYFGLYRIAQCSKYDAEVQTVSINDVERDSYPNPLNILFRNYTTPSDQKTETCLNNGYLIDTTYTNKSCICPLGFDGNYCERGCGMNSYGEDCNEICSIDNNMCRGMLMCTEYECSCPAGLTGPLCNEDCESGTYGSDCRQTCPANCQNNTCDQYTGVCLNDCLPGYILPHCIKKYPYLANAPTPISIEYESIKLELDFQPYNIIGGDESIHEEYYQIFYKSLNEDTFRYSEIKLINQSDDKTTETLYDLQPKTKYLVGVLLITNDGNQNDQDIVYGEYMTSCIHCGSNMSCDNKSSTKMYKSSVFEQPQVNDYNLKLISGVKSIYVTWNKITSNRFECDVIEHVLTLQLSLSDQSHSILNNAAQEIIANSDRSHLIDNLIPGFQYDIQFTPKTIKGPLRSSPTYLISTLMRGNYISAKNLTLKNEEGKIKINWKLINLHQNTVNEPVTCIIRYKIVKMLSCSLGVIKRNWTSIKVFNRTKYEIFDVIPNSQYIIQVLVDDEDTSTIEQKNMAYILTSKTYPKTEPILDNEHPIYVTNNSVSIQWKMDPEKCFKLNGFFSKFYIQLKDKEDITLQTKETKQNYISFGGLKSNTAYELKVFIKTHVGYNSEHFLLVNFTTKYDDLLPVDDLMVYKKSLKNRMAGFRWSYVVNTNIDGFIVSFNDTTSVIPLEKCSAWPQYYCHTFYNLSPSNNYTFKIMPRSPDYPEGGKVSSISFNSIDGLPDPPMNLKTIEVGSTSITLQWDIPWIFNGVIKTFNINAEEISAFDMNTCCVSITPIEISVDEELPNYNYTLTNLRPGSTYSIGVLTVSKSLWYSSLSRVSVETIH